MTGGRDGTSRELVERVLDFLRPRRVAHGDARGADTFAREWALSRGFQEWAYPVTNDDWRLHGPRAGLLRNLNMLERERELGLSAYLISFPGGNGTSHCTNLALHTGWHVVKVDIEGALRLRCPIKHSHQEDERWVRAHFGDSEAVVQALLTEGKVP